MRENLGKKKSEKKPKRIEKNYLMLVTTGSHWPTIFQTLEEEERPTALL